MKRILRRWWWLLIPLALAGAVWLLPISGQVVLAPRGSAVRYPRMRLEPGTPRPGQETTLWITDDAPWSHVRLTVDGQPFRRADWEANPGGTWTWTWTFTVPEDGAGELVFYRDCHTGCIARGRTTVGRAPPSQPPDRTPTALGVIFANPERDWHGRSGWDVELTYARLAGEDHWGIDDLAARVQRATAQGLRVLVRVDYDQGQSLPPEGDELALTEYLQYLQRLARDERLDGVYAYFLGSGYNGQGQRQNLPPAWYARVFNGYGEQVAHADNAVQVIRTEDPQARLLVGPLQPWNQEQDGERTHEIDAPWLNYFNTLVAALDEAAQVKAMADIPLAAPDGFAVQAPGRPDAPEMAGRDRAEEPRIDLRRESWDGAQAGFRVYRDWLAIINGYPTTRGLPVYVTSTNTFAPDVGVPPAQNYPAGWLTTALEVIDEEPQVRALCWFLDYFPHDTQWEYFSLTRQPGQMLDAAEEFDALLQRE